MRTSKNTQLFLSCGNGRDHLFSWIYCICKNSNDNPLWNTSSVNASSAYKTVNGLADELPSLLMGIDAISKVVYNKGAISLGTTWTS